MKVRDHDGHELLLGRGQIQVGRDPMDHIGDQGALLLGRAE